MTRKSEPRVALFPGSFNPFTRGHESLVRRALTFCDRVVIAVGVNIGKDPEDAERNCEAIRRVFTDDPNVDVTSYTGLTGDLAKRTEATFLLRGARNAADFEYERNMADANRNLFGIETVILPTLPELSWISSSTARELSRFGHDPKELLPRTLSTN